MLMKLHKFIERGNVLKNKSLPTYSWHLHMYYINFDLNCFKSFLLHGYLLLLVFFMNTIVT